MTDPEVALEQGKALLEKGRNEEACENFIEAAEILMSQGQRLSAACNYINGAVCLEREEMLEKAQLLIDKAFQTLLADHALVDELVENWFNEYIIGLSKDNPKNALAIIEDENAIRAFKILVSIAYGYRYYEEARKRYEEWQSEQSSALALMGAMLFIHAAWLQTGKNELGESYLKEELSWAGDLLQMAGLSFSQHPDESFRKVMPILLSYCSYKLFFDIGCIPCAIWSCYEARTLTRAESMVLKYKDRLAENCLRRKIKGPNYFCERYFSEFCNSLMFMGLRFPKIKRETKETIVDLLEAAINQSEEQLDRIPKIADPISFQAYGAYLLTNSKKFLWKASSLTERAAEYHIKTGRKRRGLFLKAWAEWHNFCLSGSVDCLESGARCVERALTIRMHWPDDPTDDSLSELLKWFMGFHSLSKSSKEENLSEKLKHVERARKILAKDKREEAEEIAVLYCNLLEKMLLEQYTEKTIEIVKKLKLLCGSSPSLTGMVATRKLGEFLTRLEVSIKAYNKLLASHPESKAFSKLSIKLGNLKTSLANLATQIELFHIGLGAHFWSFLPWERVALEKESKYAEDLKGTISIVLEETEPDYRKLGKIGKKIAKISSEEIASTIVDQIVKGAGTGIPFVSLLTDQYLGKRKFDKLCKKIIARLYQEGLKDEDKLADIVKRDREWVKRTIEGFTAH